MDDKKIYVFYVDVTDVEYNKIQEYLQNIHKRMITESFVKSLGESELVILPIIGQSRFECINPKYITEADLVEEHKLKMETLHTYIEKMIPKTEE